MLLPTMPEHRPARARGRHAAVALEASRGELRRLDERLAARGASPMTAKIYRGWVRRFLAHAGGRRLEPGIAIDRFLAGLRVKAFSTASQRQALAALGFLFREVHGIDATALLRPHRPVRRRPAPTPATAATPAAAAPAMDEPGRELVARLASASGRPEAEILALRIGDIDLERGLVRLRRDGVARRRGIPVTLPPELREALMEQVGESWRVHQLDFLAWLDRRASPGFAGARLPTEVFLRKPLFPALAPPLGRGAARRREGLPGTGPVKKTGGTRHAVALRPSRMPSGHHADLPRHRGHSIGLA
jgi:integrase